VILAPYASPPRAIGFIFENDRTVEPLRRYVVTVDSIESVTGMDFFSALPDRLENAMEAYTDIFKWDI
jgi:endonuclease G